MSPLYVAHRLVMHCDSQNKARPAPEVSGFWPWCIVGVVLLLRRSFAESQGPLGAQAGSWTASGAARAGWRAFWARGAELGRPCPAAVVGGRPRPRAAPPSRRAAAADEPDRRKAQEAGGPGRTRSCARLGLRAACRAATTTRTGTRRCTLRFPRTLSCTASGSGVMSRAGVSGCFSTFSPPRATVSAAFTSGAACSRYTVPRSHHLPHCAASTSCKK